jgi:hypothetical protein
MIPDPRREALNIAGGFVAAGLISILGFVTWALVYVAVPEANNNALTLLIGILSANVGMVVGFFFGSNVSSKRQTETIDTLAKTAQTAGVALSGDPAAIVLKEGQSATATATPAGTVIEPQSPKVAP